MPVGNVHGKLFSKTYLRQPPGTPDSISPRLRGRLAVFGEELSKSHDSIRASFCTIVESETGIEVPRGYEHFLLVGQFFKKADIRDVMDGVTALANALGVEGEGRARARWIEFCQRAFDEEGAAHSVDENGGVHYRIDVAFQEIAESVIAALAGEGYSAASTSINEAVEHLTKARPDSKAAIRAVFEGVENTFKVVTDSGTALTANNVASLLRPIVAMAYSGSDAVAKGAAEQTLEALKDWTNACHKYRHGYNDLDPIEPSLELAIVLVGSGLNYARWLASIRRV